MLKKSIFLFILEFFIVSSYSQSVHVLNNSVSLQILDSLQLFVNTNKNLYWWTNNSSLKVTQKGKIYLDKKLEGTNIAKVFVGSSLGKGIDSCEVTEVDWSANKSKLIIEDILTSPTILTSINGEIIFSEKNTIYKTSDGFRSKQYLGNLPGNPSNTPLLVTPMGNFLRCSERIYYSKSFADWLLVFEGKYDGLYNGFDFHYDGQRKVVYLYISEYTWDNVKNEHNVYRGVVHQNGKSEWKTILHFYSRGSYQITPQTRPITRHIHVVSVDPYTGNLWVGTGDHEHECSIYYSNNNGESFNLLGMGTQDFRTLSFWFTSKYIYWNMDSSDPQSIWRIARSAFNELGICPSMSPELDNGFTKIGNRYYVVKNDIPGFFPVSDGKVFTETIKRQLNSSNKVIPFGDEEFSFKEKVAEISCGSMWYVLNVKTLNEKNITIMGVSNEGNHYDTRPRVFGIEERHDGSINIQEVLTLPATVLGSFAQLEPKTQDKNGYIYFKSRLLSYNGIYKTSLVWKESTNYSNYKAPTHYITRWDENYIVYPNPNSGHFILQNLSGFKAFNKYSFEITNINGMEVFKLKKMYNYLEMEEFFDLDLPKGIYILKVIVNGNIDYSCKFTIF